MTSIALRMSEKCSYERVACDAAVSAIPHAVRPNPTRSPGCVKTSDKQGNILGLTPQRGIPATARGNAPGFGLEIFEP